MIHFNFQNKFFQSSNSVHQISSNHHNFTLTPMACPQFPPFDLRSESRLKPEMSPSQGPKFIQSHGVGQTTLKFSIGVFSLHICATFLQVECGYWQKTVNSVLIFKKANFQIFLDEI